MTTPSSRARALGVAACVALLAGCGPFALGGGSPAALDRYNNATAAFDESISSYLALGDRADPRTGSDWSDFLDDGERETKRLRATFNAWSDAVDDVFDADALPASEDPAFVREYQSAARDWVSAMEDQLRLTRPCYPSDGAGPPDEGCFMAVLSEHGDRWMRAGERINQLIAQAHS